MCILLTPDNLPQHASFTPYHCQMMVPIHGSVIQKEIQQLHKIRDRRLNQSQDYPYRVQLVYDQIPKISQMTSKLMDVTVSVTNVLL